MDYIKRIRSRASKVPKKIILSEGTDDRVILAAIESVVEGLGVMTLIGPVNFISEKIKKFTLLQIITLELLQIKKVELGKENLFCGLIV